MQHSSLILDEPNNQLTKSGNEGDIEWRLNVEHANI